jgi:hypothetical protein
VRLRAYMPSLTKIRTSPTTNCAVAASVVGGRIP